MVESGYEPRAPILVPPTVDPIAEIGSRTRPRLRPRAPIVPRGGRELALVAVFSLVLGFAQGARIAIGEGPAAVSAGPARISAPVATGTLERDAIRGPLWRPEGSIARRPRAALRPVIWRPAGSNVELSGPIGERTIERAPRPFVVAR